MTEIGLVLITTNAAEWQGGSRAVLSLFTCVFSAEHGAAGILGSCTRIPAMQKKNGAHAFKGPAGAWMQLVLWRKVPGRTWSSSSF